VSLADAWVIFLFERGEGNEKIICGTGGNVPFGDYGLQWREWQQW
jgi:hypothetical protein